MSIRIENSEICECQTWLDNFGLICEKQNAPSLPFAAERRRREDHLVNVAVQLTLRGSEVREWLSAKRVRRGGMAFVGKMHRFATLTTSPFVLSLVN